MPKTKLEQELSEADYIYVLSADGDPLMPTRRRGHVKRLLNRGKARIVSHVPFVIQLKYDGPKNTQPLFGGIDPGRTNIGAAVVTPEGKCVYRSHTASRNRDVPKNMEARKSHRQASRRGERLRRKRRARANGTTTEFPDGRMLPGYKKPVMVKDIINTTAKFNYRKRPEKWLTPTANQLVQTHENLICRISAILPVTDWTIEANKFAFMQMDNGKCYGTDFQNGRMKGYKNSHEYVYIRQNGVCPMCGAPIEHYHHIIPRSRGGSDLPENILGVCMKCHAQIHKGELRSDMKGVMKKYGSLSVLNQAIPYIWQWMTETYGEDHAHFCTGVETQTVRDDSGLPKDHDIDALCIACIGSGITPVRRLPRTFEIVQFCRHSRANINNQRERTYRLDGRIVCRNRHKRFEQKGDSLEEFRQKYPDQVSRLTVTKSTRYYNDADRLMPGAVFLFDGERYVLQSQLTGGRYYRAVGCEKRNFPAAKCTIIRENAGLVYV